MIRHWLALFTIYVFRRKIWCEMPCDDGSLHLYPLRDLIVHTAEDDCVCGPAEHLITSDDDSDQWYYKHHSLDAREAKVH